MAEKKVTSDPTSPGNLYLIFYNVFLSLGWLILLIQLVHHLATEGGQVAGLWENTHNVLLIFQSLAFLEIVHAAVGLVPSSVMVVLPQVFSRLMVTWGILYSFPETRTSVGFPMLLLAWSVTEVIRYNFYFLNIIKQVPFALIFLRYTLFIVLYPLGVTGELLCVYAAMPAAKANRPFSVPMPNSINFAFDFYYFLIVFVFLYLPTFPMLYTHMLAQRKKVLGAPAKKQD